MFYVVKHAWKFNGDSDTLQLGVVLCCFYAEYNFNLCVHTCILEGGSKRSEISSVRATSISQTLSRNKTANDHFSDSQIIYCNHRTFKNSR